MAPICYTWLPCLLLQNWLYCYHVRWAVLTKKRTWNPWKSTMYELITCFHTFCNYESTNLFSRNCIFLLFYEENVFDWDQTMERNANVKIINRYHSRFFVRVGYETHKHLKYGFCNRSFRKDEPLSSRTLFQHICPHFWLGLLDATAWKLWFLKSFMFKKCAQFLWFHGQLAQTILNGIYLYLV